MRRLPAQPAQPCPACDLVVLSPIVNCSLIGKPDIYECPQHGLFQGGVLTWKRRVCVACGHPECPTSQGSGWCDEMVDVGEGDSEMCCDGECAYFEEAP